MVETGVMNARRNGDGASVLRVIEVGGIVVGLFFAGWSGCQVRDELRTDRKFRNMQRQAELATIMYSRKSACLDRERTWCARPGGDAECPYEYPVEVRRDAFNEGLWMMNQAESLWPQPDWQRASVPWLTASDRTSNFFKEGLFDHVDMRCADLREANLKDANFFGANLRGARLPNNRAMLRTIDWREAVCPNGGRAGSGSTATCADKTLDVQLQSVDAGSSAHETIWKSWCNYDGPGARPIWFDPPFRCRQDPEI